MGYRGETIKNTVSLLDKDATHINGETATITHTVAYNLLLFIL